MYSIYYILVQYTILLYLTFMNLPPTTFNPAKDARKHQLIKATTDCIYQFGLEQTTISRVTQAADLSVGIVNFYFESKEKLLLGTLYSVTDEFQQKIAEAVGTETAPEKILERIIRVHFTPAICSPEKIAVWHAFSNASRTRQDYNEICGELEKQVWDILIHQISLLCEAEKMEHYNPAALTRGLEGMLDSFWQEYLYQPDEFDLEQANQQCMQYLSSLFPNAFQGNLSSIKTTQDSNKEFYETELLAPWTYFSQEFFDLEIEHLFKPNWMLAGHVSELSQPRDYITFDGFGERAFILRGDDNQIRGFHNVCRHRGARLVEGNGSNCPHALSCPFHGWTYDLTGKLIAVPAKNTFSDLNQENNGLIPLDLEVWMGFVFIRFQPGGKSLSETMAPVGSLISPYNIGAASKIPATQFADSKPYNWKVIHDIDNEGYHVPVGHPALQQLYGKDYSDNYVGDISVSKGYLNQKPGKLWSVKQYQKLLPKFDHLPEDMQRLWLYIGVFPNLVIGLYPESIEFYMTIPESPTSTRYTGGSFGLPDARREVAAARYLNRRINDTTTDEDEKFVRWMQAGMKSSAFPEQKLSSLEQGVRNFHKDIQQVIPVARLANQPEAGTVAKLNSSLVI